MCFGVLLHDWAAGRSSDQESLRFRGPLRLRRDHQAVDPSTDATTTANRPVRRDSRAGGLTATTHPDHAAYQRRCSCVAVFAAAAWLDADHVSVVHSAHRHALRDDEEAGAWGEHRETATSRRAVHSTRRIATPRLDRPLLSQRLLPAAVRGSESTFRLTLPY